MAPLRAPDWTATAPSWRDSPTRFDADCFGVGDEGADLGGGVERMADAEGSGLGGEAFDEVGGDIGVDEDALDGDADLAGVGVGSGTARAMQSAISASGSTMRAELLPSSRVTRLRPASARMEADVGAAREGDRTDGGVVDEQIADGGARAGKEA